MHLWRIASDTRDYEAHDLSGKGAERTGGRWNRAGRPVVYAAASVALACLETVVHLAAEALPLNRFLVRIEVPDAVWDRRIEWSPEVLPVVWTAVPEGKVTLDHGDDWLQRNASALLVVPSVIVPEEFNVLINPRHPEAVHCRARKMRPWAYDQRFRSPASGRPMP